MEKDENTLKIKMLFLMMIPCELKIKKKGVSKTEIKYFEK